MVSIIIINYNTFSLTCRCIRAVMEKTKVVEYEIILVDNASSEKNPVEFLKLFPNIKLIRNQENLGFAKGNNVGIAQAKGSFILLLNSDAFLKNDAIAITTKFLTENPKIAAVTGRLEYPDGQVQHNCQQFPSLKSLFFELSRLQKIFPKTAESVLFGPFFKYDAVAYPDWIWGTYFMFRKIDLNKLPGKKLAEDFFMYGEDMQWCWEFTKLNFKVAFVPEARIEHLLGASGASKLGSIDSNYQRFLGLYYARWKVPIIKALQKLLSP